MCSYKTNTQYPRQKRFHSICYFMNSTNTNNCTTQTREVMQRLMFYLILKVGNEVIADPRYVFREVCEVDLFFILL